MHQMQLITDCEGPLALNDYAFELCREFIQPHGNKFFTQVLRYEDYLARLAKRPDFQAGDALKLILPFLKAHGLTNALMRDFAVRNLRLVPGAEAAYRFLQRVKFPIFEISTSYRQFAEAVGSKLGFAPDHIVGTEVDLDRDVPGAAEAEELQRLEKEVVDAPAIDLPPGAGSLAELPEPVQEAISQMDRIFFERLPAMDIKAIYREVKPMGGPEKAKVVSGIMAKTGLKLTDTIYVGDGSTDVQAFEAVRAGGGLAISFNGSRQAVAAAEVVVIADFAWPIALLTAIFRQWGKEGVLEVAQPESRAKSRALVLPEDMVEPIMMGLQDRQFNLYMSSGPNREKVAQESEAMRARLRGEAIASGQ